MKHEFFMFSKPSLDRSIMLKSAEATLWVRFFFLFPCGRVQNAFESDSLTICTSCSEAVEVERYQTPLLLQNN